MITERKAANAIGGKTARACDGCLQKRARWYCAADDAFLCQTCDSSVHCANQLAGRHERVRIDNASSNKSKINGTSPNNSKTESEVANVAVSPVWHQGFTKKARTPRPSNRSSNNNNNNNTNVSGPLRAKGDKEGKSIISHTSDDNPLVPEIGWEEEFLEDEYDRMVDENLLFQVPVFDPFDEGIEGLANNNVIKNTEENFNIVNINIDEDHDNYYREDGIACGFDDNLHGFLPSDLDLAEFAADVESLLGGGDGSNGLDEDSCDIKGFGLSDCKKESDENNINNSDNVWAGDKKVKVKDEENEALNWQMEYELSPVVVGEEEEKVVAEAETTMMMVNLNGGEEINKVEVKRSVSLRLNYEAVINAWASQGCPWTTGRRPEFNPNDDCWPDCMSACSKHVGQSYGGLGFHTGGKDGGREAKVSRYREKRRTRLFSKKIRYEVRKLNAEKRPRMKGRFVKRTSLLGTTSYPNYQ